MIQHDTLDQTMFWTGAMFAFTPIIIAGVVLAVWWRGHRRAQRGLEGHEPGQTGGSVSQRTDGQGS